MNESLRGRTALVTGADGFIGSHLVEALAAAGTHVRAFVYYNSWNQIGWLGDVQEEVLHSISIVPGDIRDPELVRDAVRDCDYVFHLSSLIGIPYSFQAPSSYIDTNIRGALNVLQGCRATDQLARLLHVSTSEVYGTAQTVPISEDHPLVAQSPYSASKIGADKIAESYHHAFDLPVVIARPFNTYGPRQTTRAVIPTIASQLLGGCDELTLGALHPTRDFNFVTDTVHGMMAAITSEGLEGETVNIGSGEEWSIQETAELLMEIVGHTVPIRTREERMRPGKSEVDRLIADSTKLRTRTSWKSRVPFREGLQQTVDWIRRNRDHFDADRYSI